MSEQLTDDNAEKKPAPISQDMARKFTFAVHELQPYSFNRRVTFFRIRSGDMSRIEWAVLLLYICTRTAAECDTARDEGIPAFRMAAMEWAESLGIDKPAVATEVMSVADAIEKNHTDAVSVEPETGGASGNA